MIAQGPSPIWTKDGIGSKDDAGHRLCTDNQGNIIVSGVTESPVLTISTTTLNCASINPNNINKNIFLAKYKGDGTLLWAQNMVGDGDETIESICTDNAGNIIVSGFFTSDTLFLGNYKLSNTASNNWQIFLVKYSSTGNLIWAKSIGGSLSDGYSNVCIENNNNIILAARFEGGVVNLGNATYTITGGSNYLLMVKYDATGNLIWVKGDKKTAGGIISGLKSDPLGNFFITGCFYGDSITFETNTIYNTGASDIFLAKFNSSGNLIWIKHYGGTDADKGIELVTDIYGNVCTVGYFESPSMIFGDSTFYNPPNVTNARTIYIARYNSAGQLKWVNTFYGHYYGYIEGLTADSKNNFYLTGILGTTAYIKKYDSTGHAKWSGNISSYSETIGTDIKTDQVDNIFFTGSFRGQKVFFGNDTLINRTTNSSDAEMYLIKFVDNTPNSIFEFKNVPGLKIFPNPAHDFIEAETTFDVSEIRIFDLAGQRVLTSNRSKKIQVSNLLPGIYFLEIRNSDGYIQKRQKFIKN